MMTDEEDQFRRVIGRWRFTAVVFIVVSLFLSVLLIALAIFIHRKPKPNTLDFCGDIKLEHIDTTEADNPGVFDDLTNTELSAIQKYIYSKQELNLVRPIKASLDKSYVFTMDLHLPNKEFVLEYLDGKRSKPDREALVVIFRGDKSPPVVEEYIVGPLPNPSYIILRYTPNRPNPIPYNARPIGSVEYIKIFKELLPKIGSKLKQVLEESYETGLFYPECGKKCLSFIPSPLGSGALGANERKLWLVITHFVEYRSLHPLGLSFLLKDNSSDPGAYFVESLVYNGQRFKSMDDFVMRYNSGKLIKHKVSFPVETVNLFSTVNLRGGPFPEKAKRPPKLFEPDGKRYTINHRHVEYMQWKFHFSMSIVSGPQIFNVRFNDQRIAYEVSLQEITVFFSGDGPAHKTSDFIDSVGLLGILSHGLISGTDCPDTSTFIDGFYLNELTDKPNRNKNMFCIFEENSGFPLRRHAGYHRYQGQFYSGMMDSSLVLRSAMTIGNFNYIVDYVFHQNGALQIRVAATGYMYVSFYTPKERGYGFRLHNNILGNMHHHMFNFKLDIDINGTSNRYETLDISATEVKNDYSVSNATYWQTRFQRRLKRTELRSRYKYDFRFPKYHVIHNNEVKTRHGEISGYRLHLEGMSYQPLPENKGNEATISWSRFPLAVTKVKDNERSSSSCYAMFDSLNPVVNFTSFWSDNENVVDEDLVVWATVGHHHIPHTEDLPLTPTTGSHLGIFLLPYNYFQECPSMASRDAIRLDPKDRGDPAAGINIERYGNSQDNMCIPRSVKVTDNSKNSFRRMFD